MEGENDPLLGSYKPKRRRSSLVYGLSRPQFLDTAASEVSPIPQERPTTSLRKPTPRVQRPATDVSYGALEETEENESIASGLSVQEDFNSKAWWKELTLLIKFATPVVLTSLLQYGEVVTTVFSLGHLGKTELAAASLSNMTATITAFAIYQGIVSALDTVGTQSFGSGNYEMVGLHLQRILAILLLIQFPIFLIWWKIEGILLFLRQDPLTCMFAAKYMRVMMLASPAYALFEALKRFLQVQGIFHPVTYILAIVVPINIFLNYLFVWSPWVGFGFLGAPVAIALTLWSACAVLIIYIMKVNGRQAWGGFSREALKNWGPLCRLAVPGVIMICSEYWAFELVTFASGVLGTTELASMSVLSTTSTLSYNLAFGVAAAAATRVGNLIGAGNTKLAKLATHVSINLGAAIGVIIAVILFLTRNTWTYIFTSDKDVVALVATIIPLVALINIADNTQCVAGGLLRGQGRQRIGGVVNFIAYYLLGLPVAIILCFKLDWGLYGLWIGIGAAILIIAGVETWCSLHVNWDHLVELANRQFDEA
ncbi:MatE family transporter [Schizosaccharomyces pombe]